VLWVEDVGRGRIIDDDCFSKVAADLGEVLKGYQHEIRSEALQGES